MKKQIITAALLLTATIIITSCGSNNSETKTEYSASEESATVQYQCPMKCEGDKKYDRPGSCPVCNMDLEKVEGSQEHHEDDTTEHHNH